MCCIFTCCGWVIDVIQRLWVFAMSWCVGAAVCCSLFISSMAGISLGYNYSLAEYIDLKENNVSVYMKRGVFDDEIADELDWRRSSGDLTGRKPVENLRRSADIDDDKFSGRRNMHEQPPLRPERRLDDAVIASGDELHKFESGLVRLTAKPPSHIEKTTIKLFTEKPDGYFDNIEDAKVAQALGDFKLKQAMGDNTPTPDQNMVNPHYMPTLQVLRRMGSTPATFRTEGTLENEFYNAVPVAVQHKELGISVVPARISPDAFQKKFVSNLGTTRRFAPADFLPGLEAEKAMGRYLPKLAATKTKQQDSKPSGLLPHRRKGWDPTEIKGLTTVIPHGKDVPEDYEDYVRGVPVRKRRHAHRTPGDTSQETTEENTPTKFNLAAIKWNSRLMSKIMESSRKRVMDTTTSNNIPATENPPSTEFCCAAEKWHSVLMSKIMESSTKVGIQMAVNNSSNTIAANNISKNTSNDSIYDFDIDRSERINDKLIRKITGPLDIANKMDLQNMVLTTDKSYTATGEIIGPNEFRCGAGKCNRSLLTKILISPTEVLNKTLENTANEAQGNNNIRAQKKYQNEATKSRGSQNNLSKLPTEIVQIAMNSTNYGNNETEQKSRYDFGYIRNKTVSSLINETLQSLHKLTNDTNDGALTDTIETSSAHNRHNLKISTNNILGSLSSVLQISMT